MNISHHPVDRNTKACRIDIGMLSLFFSYNTLIAASYPGVNGRVRRRNDWGPTTGRHMKDLQCYHFPEVTEEELDKFVEDALHDMAMFRFTSQLGAADTIHDVVTGG